MKYKVYVALREDINSGWVWVSGWKYKQRSVIHLYNPVTRKCVYCEVLQIDKNFIKYYNAQGGGRLTIQEEQPNLVVNEWYRYKLGIYQPQIEHELLISEADNWVGKAFACIQHPQLIVRVAFWLAVISVALGLLGVVFGIISLF